MSPIVVTQVLRFEVVGEDDQPGTEYVAVRALALAAVPQSGDEMAVAALRARATVDKVGWSDDGRIAVHLRRFRALVGVLDQLEQGDWEVEPWAPEPPSEWLQ